MSLPYIRPPAIYADSLYKSGADGHETEGRPDRWQTDPGGRATPHRRSRVTSPGRFPPGGRSGLPRCRCIHPGRRLVIRMETGDVHGASGDQAAPAWGPDAARERARRGRRAAPGEPRPAPARLARPTARLRLPRRRFRPGDAGGRREAPGACPACPPLHAGLVGVRATLGDVRDPETRSWRTQWPRESTSAWTIRAVGEAGRERPRPDARAEPAGAPGPAQRCAGPDRVARAGT